MPTLLSDSVVGAKAENIYSQRRPETTLGGMLILRHRSAVAFLHNQDPIETFGR